MNSYILKIKQGWSLKSFKEILLFFWVIFFVCFPKGGVKIATLPLTWGYALFFLSWLLSFTRRKFLFSQPHLLVFIGFLPFLTVSFLTMLINGIDDYGYAISYFIHFFCVGSFFLLNVPSSMNKEEVDTLLCFVKKALFFISAYGIFLFFFKILTGRFFQIPLLTVNLQDFGALEETKCIDRGGVFKLISTYNNGNLYGVCVLMLLPLYDFLETRRFFKLIVKGSLIFTLSRTVWLGLACYQLCEGLFFQASAQKKIKNFVFTMLFFLVSFFFISSVFPLSMTFLFDRFLGHRIGQFEVLKQVEWFSTKPFQGIYEVIYLGMLSSFGIIGLFTFLWAFITPLLLLCLQKNKLSMIQKRAAFGLYLYLFIACADGALLLIPVLTFCFFLLFLLSSDLNRITSFKKDKKV